jgi:hypothetical protein
MKKHFSAILLTLCCSVVLAQGAGMTPEPAAEPGTTGSSGSSGDMDSSGGGAAGSGMSGPGESGRHRMHFNKENTPGWSMMTPDERRAYGDKMSSFTAVDECRTYQQQHMSNMQARAKQRKQSMNPSAMDPCDMLQQQGIIN